MIAAGLLLAGQRAASGRPFDALARPALAWSVRRLSSSYTGPAMRVRRSSDNAEVDIGFTGNGMLDTEALAEHCGAGDGRLVRWYNQGTSGANGDLRQTTPAAQPFVYQAGAVVRTMTGRPAVGGGWLSIGSPDLTRFTRLTASLVAQMGNGLQPEIIISGSGAHWRILCLPSRKLVFRWWDPDWAEWVTIAGENYEVPSGRLARFTTRCDTTTGQVYVLRRLYGWRRYWTWYRRWVDYADHYGTHVCGHLGTSLWTGLLSEIVLWPVPLPDTDIEAFEASQVAFYEVD